MCLRRRQREIDSEKEKQKKCLAKCENVEAYLIDHTVRSMARQYPALTEYVPQEDPLNYLNRSDHMTCKHTSVVPILILIIMKTQT